MKPEKLQVMVTKEVAEQHGGLKALVSTGTSILVSGTVTKPPEGAKQVIGQVPDDL